MSKNKGFILIFMLIFLGAHGANAQLHIITKKSNFKIGNFRNYDIYTSKDTLNENTIQLFVPTLWQKITNKISQEKITSEQFIYLLDSLKKRKLFEIIVLDTNQRGKAVYYFYINGKIDRINYYYSGGKNDKSYFFLDGQLYKKKIYKFDTIIEILYLNGRKTKRVKKTIDY